MSAELLQHKPNDESGKAHCNDDAAIKRQRGYGQQQAEIGCGHKYQKRYGAALRSDVCKHAALVSASSHWLEHREVIAKTQSRP